MDLIRHFIQAAIPISVIFILQLSLSTNALADTLKIFNWEDYMDPDVMAEYTEKTGVTFEETYFDSDEERDDLLEKTKGKGFDIILVSDLELEGYVRKGWIKALPEGYSDQLGSLDKRWWYASPAAEWYAIPYFWGTLGIAYRKDLVTSPITSWKQFFTPSKDLHGKIAVMNSTREATGMALKSLGHSLNTRSFDALNKAIKILEKQSPAVAQYAYVSLDESSALLNGDIVATMMYSGDTLMLQELNENIEYVLPKEGGNIWVDYLVVSSHSNKQQQAWDFIKHLNTPEIAARQADFVYYATPNKAAEKLMDDEFLSNSTIYPSPAALKKSEFFEPIIPRHLKRLDTDYGAIMEQQ